MARRWFSFPTLRLLTRLVKAQEAQAVALTRVADFLEGKTPPEPITEDAPSEDLREFYRNDQEILRADQIARDLHDTLGREPTDEEIVRALDGVEWTAEDADAHRRKVVEEIAEQAQNATARKWFH